MITALGGLRRHQSAVTGKQDMQPAKASSKSLVIQIKVVACSAGPRSFNGRNLQADITPVKPERIPRQVNHETTPEAALIHVSQMLPSGAETTHTGSVRSTSMPALCPFVAGSRRRPALPISTEQSGPFANFGLGNVCVCQGMCCHAMSLMVLSVVKQGKRAGERGEQGCGERENRKGKIDQAVTRNGGVGRFDRE